MPIASLRPNAIVRNVASIRIGFVAAFVLGRELPKPQHNFCNRSDFSRLGMNPSDEGLFDFVCRCECTS
jgi:hypothetical protein